VGSHLSEPTINRVNDDLYGGTVEVMMIRKLNNRVIVMI
jgi:hypothetical protein